MGSSEVGDVNDTIVKGIDGVYKRTVMAPDGTLKTEYVVAEAKYGTSQLGQTKTGQQMSDQWINARLDKAMGEPAVRQMEAELVAGTASVTKEVVRISDPTSVDMKNSSSNVKIENLGNLIKSIRP